MYAGYINIFDLGKLSKSLKNKNLDQPLALITIAYIIMTMHVFNMNMAGGDNRGVLYVASFTCPPVPLMSGHLSCTDNFA